MLRSLGVKSGLLKTCLPTRRTRDSRVKWTRLCISYSISNQQDQVAAAIRLQWRGLQGHCHNLK